VDKKEVVSPKYIHIWYQKHKHFVTLTADSMNNVLQLSVIQQRSRKHL